MGEAGKVCKLAICLGLINLKDCKPQYEEKCSEYWHKSRFLLKKLCGGIWEQLYIQQGKKKN